MKFKTEFYNAVQLFCLLCALFWSLTWNSAPNLDLSPINSRNIKQRTASKGKTNDVPLTNRYSVFLESFAATRHEPREKTETNLLTNAVLPPFKEWREKEMTKYGNGLSGGKASRHQRKPIRRKLNYSSSKCGAKILASNKEVRHKTAVLNEKADEYMLNPCRIRTWFIIELCDTVEATEIELANYELYSSSPKQFSVFWSAVYPTLMWHDLGTFEAKDQRTMQTFGLNKKNLGKFIKVIIYNHHGKEHYCPLSVIRVLGYSMVQEFEAVEDSNINQELLSNYESKAKDEKNGSLTESLQTLQDKITSEYKKVLNSNSSSKICSLYRLYCSSLSTKISKKKCYESRVCNFFEIVIEKSKKFCYEGICLKKIETIDEIKFCVKKDSENYVSYLSESNKTNLSNKYGTTKKVTKLVDLYTSPTRCSKTLYMRKLDCNTKRQIQNTGSSSTAFRGPTSKARTSTLLKFPQKPFVNITTQRKANASGKNSKYILTENKPKKCVCENEVNVKSVKYDKDPISDKAVEQELFDFEYSVESAGLIQKESVLMKLTSRIKASETDLNLINAYLQQLSQSYREQMEDMHTTFHQTIKAIHIASEKASVIDDKQQEELKSLEIQTDSLKQKVEYLMNGQNYLLIRVVELHIFFLFLEIIIISTIFTILLNILQRKNTLHEKRKKLGFLKEYLRDYCMRNKLTKDNSY